MNLRIIEKRSTVFFILITLISSLISNHAFARRGADECYKRDANGTEVVVECFSGYKVLNDDEIQLILDEFKAFEKSESKSLVHDEALKRKERLKDNPIPVHPRKKKLTEQEIIERQNMSPREHTLRLLEEDKVSSQIVRASMKLRALESHLDPDVRRKIGYVKEDRYQVYAVLVNTNKYPEKSVNHDVFRENISTDYAIQKKHEIYEDIFGNKFEKYQPELNSIYDVITIYFYIKNSAELKNFLKRNKVISVNHIGSPPPLNENPYGTPSIRVKDPE